MFNYKCATCSELPSKYHVAATLVYNPIMWVPGEKAGFAFSMVLILLEHVAEV